MRIQSSGYRDAASASARPRSTRCVGLLSFLLALLASASPAAAQEGGRIIGRVTDAASGAPIAEAQVFIPGTGLGGLTRANGGFLILGVPAGTHEVRAERIGLEAGVQQVTVAAGQAVEVNFQMSTQALGLDEIVVTGTAGAARRREVGTTINQIDVTELPERAVEVTDMLQSSAPGIEVTGGGSAGQGSKIRLRGVNSASMGSDPIIYIDGVRIMTGAFKTVGSKDAPQRGANVTQSPLDMLNPNDIERIEIIKGSAATTLYGTEASAGVIQVFTKRGSQGAPVWTVETQQGTMWSQRFGMGNVDNEHGGNSDFLYMDPWICTGFLKCGKYQPVAHTQVYGASVRGGVESIQYFTSGELFDEHGNTPNDEVRKWSARGNFTFSPTNTLQLLWNTAYLNQAQSNTAQGNNAEGLELNVFRQTQNYFFSDDPELINKVLIQDINSGIERFTTGGTATFTPLADLTNRLTIGYDFSNQEVRHLRPVGFHFQPDGTILSATFQKRILTFDYVGTYRVGVTDNVNSSISWGGQAVGDEERRIEGYGLDFPGAVSPTISSASVRQGFEQRQKIWNAGFFLQNVFDISNRYFLTAGLRVDGNSAFGSGFGLQMYPKVSGAWVLSDESFWGDAWGTVKLRAAYGRSGRAPGAFDAVRTWTNSPLAGEVAFTPQNVGNPNLGPEVTGEFEVGFDAAWLDDRIRATYTYYSQLTTDALLEVGQMPSLGFTAAQLTNVGEIENKGMEVGLDFSVLQRAEWGWDLGVNVATNDSKVLSHVLAEHVGRPVLYSLHDVIRNPDAMPEIAGRLPNCSANTPEGTPCVDRNVFRGSDLPTHNINAHTTLRLPYGISLTTRGEYRGGFYTSGIIPVAIQRSVRSPLCFPYYANEENVQLKPGLNALWTARCTPSINRGHSQRADYFKLRSVTATVPMDFAVPDRIQSATLTLTMGNVWTWSKESFWGTYAFENFGNMGVGDEGQSTPVNDNERVPPPTTLRASLRFTF